MSYNLILALVIATCSGTPSTAIANELVGSSLINLHVTVDNTKLVGDELTIEVRVNAKQRVHLMNPYCKRLIAIPYNVYLLDLNGVRVLDFQVSSSGGSRRNPSANDWVELPNDSFLGTTLKVSTNRIRGTVQPEIQSGQYYIQVTASKWFLSDPPSALEIRTESFSEKWFFPEKNDNFHSNMPLIEITGH